MSANLVKRSFDLCAAILGLALFSPILLLLGAVIAALMGRPVLFRQRRVGWGERPFWFYKFRTMNEARDRDGRLLPDAQRLTAAGRFLRSTSLDELPQLWNVLKGEMSLVGPRPLLPEYVGRYSAFQRRRHEVLPGITGWAQVNGRNALAWERKFELDVWYVDNRSLRLDLKILWMTLLGVLRRDGIRQQGHATMPEFAGNAGAGIHE
jgi:sugar transferase EpsL